ncbi:hypothetical protein AB0C07_32780 [Actinoplanes missouriensis]|uniref:hypothetical protein n=1 Tax=Actinoplanes missouriensis TaxID=1866 RepID=UPI00341189D6
MSEAYPTTEERIVAEFGDGYDVEGIALRYGLSVDQVYAVVERELSQDDPAPSYPPPAYQGQGYASPGYPVQGYAPPGYPVQGYAPPGYPVQGYAPPGYPVQGYPPPGFPDEDTIVAEYGEGHAVEAIARKHGIPVDRIYEIVHRAVSAPSQHLPADPTVWQPPA